MPPKSAATEPDADSPSTRRRYAPRLPPEQRREQLLDAALEVILEQGYGGVSIEAIARVAGVTRPVVYDHYSNLGRLLQALIEREERYSLEQLEQVVPAVPGGGDPAAAARAVDPIELLGGGVKRFLDAVAARPSTWRLILLPIEGTPALVREHVESNRARILDVIEQLVRWAVAKARLPDDLDVELIARAIRDLGEEAGRMILTEPDRYTAERYERFVQSVLRLIWPA